MEDSESLKQGDSRIRPLGCSAPHEIKFKIYSNGILDFCGRCSQVLTFDLPLSPEPGCLLERKKHISIGEKQAFPMSEDSIFIPNLYSVFILLYAFVF